MFPLFIIFCDRGALTELAALSSWRSMLAAAHLVIAVAGPDPAARPAHGASPELRPASAPSASSISRSWHCSGTRRSWRGSAAFRPSSAAGACRLPSSSLGSSLAVMENMVGFSATVAGRGGYVWGSISSRPLAVRPRRLRLRASWSSLSPRPVRRARPYVCLGCSPMTDWLQRRHQAWSSPPSS